MEEQDLSKPVRRKKRPKNRLLEEVLEGLEDSSNELPEMRESKPAEAQVLREP